MNFSFESSQTILDATKRRKQVLLKNVLDLQIS